MKINAVAHLMNNQILLLMIHIAYMHEAIPKEPSKPKEQKLTMWTCVLPDKTHGTDKQKGSFRIGLRGRCIKKT